MAVPYFSSIFNPNQGSPSAFTSPGMNPQALAALMQIQNMGKPTAAPMQGQPPGQPPMQGGPQMGQPPMGGAQGAQGPQAGPGANIMQMLQSNPQLMQMLMQRLQWGGQPGQGNVGSPGMAPGMMR